MDNLEQTTRFINKNTVASLIVFENGKVFSVELNEKNKYTFGRKTEKNIPDISVLSEIVGRQHGFFEKQHNHWEYIDNGSVNGTYINNEFVSGYEGTKTKHRLNNGDVLRVDAEEGNADSRTVYLIYITDKVADEWKQYSIKGLKSISIGRADENNIIFQEKFVSRNHAIIVRKGNALILKDQKSAAGTFLNGDIISKDVQLRSNDCISICNHHLFVFNEMLIYNIESGKQGDNTVLISAHINSKVVKNNNGVGTKEILRNINVEIGKGKLVALLGGSGAGKSTFMDCINGMETSGVDGSILFEGENLINNFARLKYMIASVPQLATFHPNLSVEKELRIAAEKRLPSDWKKKDIEEQVTRMIDQLGLTAQRKTTIAKCSGGEQRRVNIAMDLIADKLLYCLDEPDAGLDPHTKKELYVFLNKMAHEDNKTIIVIIHDVTEIALFDQVIVLAKKDNVGRLAFSGTPTDAEKYFECEFKEIYDRINENPSKYISEETTNGTV